MEKDGKWIMRWKYAIAPTPVKPGVWRRREGGFLVRGRAVDRRTGKLREVMKTVDGGDASGAYRFLQVELEKIKGGEVHGRAQRIRFSEYAASLFERKVTKGKIRSAKTREKWECVLRLHLLPAFGDFFLDGIRRADIEAWLERMGKVVQSGRYSPVTVNNWLDILRVIVTSAVEEYELPRNPVAGIEDIDTSTHFTCSKEEPSSLLAGEVPVFLSGIRRLSHSTWDRGARGFATGLRSGSGSGSPQGRCDGPCKISLATPTSRPWSARRSAVTPRRRGPTSTARSPQKRRKNRNGHPGRPPKEP